MQMAIIKKYHYLIIVLLIILVLILLLIIFTDVHVAKISRDIKQASIINIDKTHPQFVNFK
jgi:uncharacterized membrane protein